MSVVSRKHVHQGDKYGRVYSDKCFILVLLKKVPCSQMIHLFPGAESVCLATKMRIEPTESITPANICAAQNPYLVIRAPAIGGPVRPAKALQRKLRLEVIDILATMVPTLH
jgi:hypothetical protein